MSVPWHKPRWGTNSAHSLICEWNIWQWCPSHPGEIVFYHHYPFKDGVGHRQRPSPSLLLPCVWYSKSSCFNWCVYWACPPQADDRNGMIRGSGRASWCCLFSFLGFPFCGQNSNDCWIWPLAHWLLIASLAATLVFSVLTGFVVTILSFGCFGVSFSLG